MQGCFENPFVNDTSLDLRPLPSLHMRTRYSALSIWNGRKEKRGNWSAANISFPVSPILFFTIKTCLIVRVAVSFAHDYSFNSRISDRSLFCFALGSLSSLQMVDIARSRCTKCLSSSHKSLKPRGESAA